MPDNMWQMPDHVAQTVSALDQVGRQLLELRDHLSRVATLGRPNARLEPMYAQQLRVQLGKTRELVDEAWQHMPA